MFERLEKIDLWLLDNVFQKIADWVWERAPISNFKLSEINLGAFCIWFILAGNTFLQKSVLTVFVFTINYLCIYRIKSRYNAKFMNYARTNPTDVYNRIFILTMQPLLVILNPHHWFDVLLFCGIFCHYFAACQSRPPIERTFRKPAVARVSA